MLAFPLRAWPVFAAVFAVVGAVVKPRATTLVLAILVVAVTTLLEARGEWAQVARRAPRSLAAATLAGALVLGGLWSIAALELGVAPPRVARR